MFKFILQTIIVFLFWRGNAKAKGSWKTPSSVLLGIYAISAICSIIAVNSGYYKEPFSSYYWLPMVFFLMFIIAFLLPFRIFNEAKIKELVLPEKSFLDALSTIIIILSFYSIFFWGSSFRTIFALSNLADARNGMVAGEEQFFEAGILATIASVSASLYVFALILFFVYYIEGKNKTRSVLLLISSLSEPLHVFAFVGRDGVVFWIFSFVFLLAFFQPYMPVNKTKSIIKRFSLFAALLLIPFFLITFSRFGDSSGGTMDSLFSYLGQSFIHGPLYFGIENKPRSYGASFPLYYEIIGKEIPLRYGEIRYGEWRSWQFSTFIVSLYTNVGLLGLIIICAVMFVYFYFKINKTCFTKMNLSHLTIYTLYFQIIGQGVFYFHQYTRGGNLFIILCLLMSLIFSITTKNSSLTLTKIN